MCLVSTLFTVFFFKQKTAYEMRISDWSSDVCSSDLHEVSPLIKFVSRGDTTVVDAYLSPILQRYVSQVASELPGVPLLFMQSSGGLTQADRFRGKDTLLSGPAGGILAKAGPSERGGIDKDQYGRTS